MISLELVLTLPVPVKLTISMEIIFIRNEKYNPYQKNYIKKESPQANTQKEKR